MTRMTVTPDLNKVSKITPELLASDHGLDLVDYLHEAREFLCYYEWCKQILEEYVGLVVNDILGIFLFRILPRRPEVDEWLWVIVGDIPPAYLTCEQCPNPASALDGYIGAMSQWVDAASNGESVAELIPVNVPATPENAERLRTRLKLLDHQVLADYRDDLKP